jgi:antibiotic biosynthesis monooxygenase (ABM) superfamily enzyme
MKSTADQLRAEGYKIWMSKNQRMPEYKHPLIFTHLYLTLF